MDYGRLGFFVVCLSPVSAIIAYLALYLVIPSLFHAGYLLPIIVHTALNVFTVGLQVAGVTLYSLGIRKSRWTPRQSYLCVGLSIVMGIWGVFTILFAASFYYGELLPWSAEPGVRALTLWDHLEYATWGLKGGLWLFSGVLFLTL